MTVTASAPGKLILLGEYAVLEGAPAFVAAVNRRATVRLTPRTDDEIRVHAPDLGIDAAGRLAPGRSGASMRWATDERSAQRLRLVAQVIEAGAGTGAGTGPGTVIKGFEATLRTTAFFDSPGVKLGLGSSAALTVALAGALAAHFDRPSPALPGLVALHRSMQGGRGSGADIAAALVGGIIAYRANTRPVPTATPLRLPAGLSWQVVFTGRSASTPQMLARLAGWRAEHPAEYARHMTALTEIAQQAADQTTAAPHRTAPHRTTPDPAALLDAIDRYASGLDALGAAAGLDIISADHRHLRNLAAAHGVIYKPSGAGGGDIGIAFSGDSGHSARFQQAVSEAGYRMIDMAVDSVGLTVADE